MEAARAKIEAATLELHELMMQPIDFATNRPEIFAAKAFIVRFDIANRVPLEGDVSYMTLSEMTGVDVGAIESLCRLAIAHRIFSEPNHGRLSHSPASKLLAKRGKQQSSKTLAEDLLLMSACLTRSLELFPRAENPRQSAAALAHEARMLTSDDEMLNEVIVRETLSATKTLPGMAWEHVANAFNWGALPPGTGCVDVGGGESEAALAVWRKFPHLHWIVERSPHNDESKEPQEHDGTTILHTDRDYFTASTKKTEKASLFLLRRVLHKWPEPKCHEILRNLIPSLSPGNRILIMERVMKPPGSIPIMEERKLRALDVGYLALRNSRERDKTAWRRLCVGADPHLRRFRLRGYFEPPGSDLTMIEVLWKG